MRSPPRDCGTYLLVLRTPYDKSNSLCMEAFENLQEGQRLMRHLTMAPARSLSIGVFFIATAGVARQ